MLVALTTVLALGSLVGTKVSDKLVLDHGFPPEKVTLAERIKDKKVILLGLPGAFTPT